MEALVETATASLTRERSSWKALEEHHQKVSKLHLRTLFAEDPKRGEFTALDAVGIYLDYSKNRITASSSLPWAASALASGLSQ
jgi:glucose-6-phosphate isomerase